MVLTAVAMATGDMNIRDSQNIKQTRRNLNLGRWQLSDLRRRRHTRAS